MARDVINVQYPAADNSQSAGCASIVKSAVTAANGVSIKNAFANKNNSLVIVIENTADEDSSVTFVAGDNYPNAMLGNLEFEVLSESIKAFQIQDISRFENKDGSLNIDFDSDFTGTIFAVAKSTALNV